MAVEKTRLVEETAERQAGAAARRGHEQERPPPLEWPRSNLEQERERWMLKRMRKQERTLVALMAQTLKP